MNLREWMARRDGKVGEVMMKREDEKGGREKEKEV